MIKLRGACIKKMWIDEADFNIDFSTMYPLYFTMLNGVIARIEKPIIKTDWEELLEVL